MAHVKKSQPDEVPRSRGVSRSVNYLSSTTASRAKSSAGARKSLVVSGASRLVGSALVDSDSSFKQKKNLVEEASAVGLTIKAASIVSTRHEYGHHKSNKAPISSLSKTENLDSGTVGTEKAPSTASSHSHKSRPGASRKAVRVTMNKTSELRAALHKRTVKSESGKIKGSKLGKVKRRPHVRGLPISAPLKSAPLPVSS